MIVERDTKMTIKHKGGGETTIHLTAGVDEFHDDNDLALTFVEHGNGFRRALTFPWANIVSVESLRAEG